MALQGGLATFMWVAGALHATPRTFQSSYLAGSKFVQSHYLPYPAWEIFLPQRHNEALPFLWLGPGVDRSDGGAVRTDMAKALEKKQVIIFIKPGSESAFLTSDDPVGRMMRRRFRLHHREGGLAIYYRTNDAESSYQEGGGVQNESTQ